MASNYGLEGFSTLPLLEQVHRLHHAMSKGYPYKETTEWKELALEQKKKILKCIQEQQELVKENEKKLAEKMRKRKLIPKEDAQTPLKKQPTQPTNTIGSTDPYLQMLRKRQDRGAIYQVDNSDSDSQMEYKLPRHGKPTSARKKKAKKWSIMEKKYLNCCCGEVHDYQNRKKLPPMVDEILKMMISFGDCEFPCWKTGRAIKKLIGDHLRSKLQPILEKYEQGTVPISALVDHFPEEIVYYKRWRDFKQKVDDDEDNGDDDTGELADELDEFCNGVQDRFIMLQRFQERMKFADARTKEMEDANYEKFASIRKANFYKKAQLFKEWLGLSNFSKAALELMNFIAYDCVGKLVEDAIKKQKDGKLESLHQPMMENFIRNSAHVLNANHELGVSKDASHTTLKTNNSAPIGTNEGKIDNQFELNVNTTPQKLKKGSPDTPKIVTTPMQTTKPKRLTSLRKQPRK